MFAIEIPQTGQRVLLVLFGLAVAAGLLLLAEGALGLLGVGDELLYDDPFVGFAEGSDLFRIKPGSGGEILETRPQKLLFFNHQEFPSQKPEGSLRIFTLGGSTTAGRPYDDRLSFSRWLERYLDAAEPGREHEVINAGAISYASYRVAVLARELVRYEPDLLVLYTGHNEFLEERSYSELIHQPEAWRAFRIWLSGFRLAALTRMAKRRLGTDEPGNDLLGDEVVTRLDTFTGLDAYHRDEELESSILAHFKSNLERLIRLTEGHGIDVILVRPASNLKDFSPFKSEFHSTTSRAERRDLMADLEAARTLLQSGQPEPARERLWQALAIDSEYAELHFQLGRAFFALGAMDEAREAFIQAKELDVAPLRALEPISESVRDAALRHNLDWIDLPNRIERSVFERFGHRIPGDETFLDHVHPDIATHSLIASEILDLLINSGKVVPGSSWSISSQEQIFAKVTAGIDREELARRDLNLAKVLGWAGKLEEAEAPLLRAREVLENEPDLYLNLGILQLKTGRFEEAAEQLEKASLLDPDSAVTHFNLGVVYGRLHRPAEGISELEEALRLRPLFPEALHNLGVLYRETSQPEEAVRALEQALDLEPEVAAVHRALGLALEEQGRLIDAEEAFRTSLRLEPSSVDAHQGLGRVLIERERYEEAERILLQGLHVDAGENADLLFQLGLLLSRGGRADDAGEMYRRCLATDPGHALAWNNLGILTASSGDLPEADRCLGKALEIDPRYAEAWLNLAVVRDRMAEPALAIDAATRAVELEPQNLRFRLALGMLLVGSGRIEAARPHLELAQAGGLELTPPIIELLSRSPTGSK